MAKAKKDESELIQALEFVSLAQRDAGAPYQTHVTFSHNTAVAFDGVLAGHLVDTDLMASPHTLTMLAALKRCTGPISLTQTDAGRLSVRSGKFRAFVPCHPSAVSPEAVRPDAPVGKMDNRVRDALLAVSPIIVENSPRVVLASALLRGGSVVATTGHVIIESWHGHDLPQLIVPKVFINALAKITKNIVSFGCSDKSLTIYFEDNSWIRTQLYIDKWPNTDRIMNKPHKPAPIAEGFVEAVETVYGFITDNRLHIRDGKVCSTNSDETGASFAVAGLASNVILNAKDVRTVVEHIKTVDFVGADGVSYFYGDNVRGCLSQFKA